MLQNEQSMTCGQHVLVYLFLKARYYSLKNILTFFDKLDLSKNDFIVKRLFEKIYK